MHQREPSYELDGLSWVDIVERLAHDPRLIIPVGALDQHGAHLPLGTNILIARQITLDLSREFRLLRAPTFSYGVIVESKEDYAGTTSLRKKSLHRAMNELLAAWEDGGVMEFIIITAHRYEPHIEAITTLYPRKARVRVVQIWDTPIADLLEEQDRPLHAGEAETSVMLFLYPELVRMDRAHDFDLDPETFRRYLDGRANPSLLASAGTIGRPSAASTEKGERIYTRILDTIRKVIFIAPSATDTDSDSL
jgi:creatinine amidohydrolase